MANAVRAYNTGCRVLLRGIFVVVGAAMASSAWARTCRTAIASLGVALAAELLAMSRKIASVARERSARGRVEIENTPP
jgi:hypothetical protein